MTPAYIDEIEQRLAIRLPAAYRNTVLDYPFPRGSFADELMLPNRAKDVIELNQASLLVPGIEQFLVIDSDVRRVRRHRSSDGGVRGVRFQS